MASEWVPIRPGADAYLLMAMVQVITSEGLVDLGALRRPRHRPRRGRGGGGAVHAGGRGRTPPGSTPTTIRRLARELAAAPTACVYGRIGTTTAEFGTLTSWLVDVLNVLTGNLDRPGGAMFTKAAAGASNTRGKPRYGRDVKPPPAHQPRARAARDLRRAPGGRAWPRRWTRPGEGQIRALVTVAGNPVLSTPNSARLDAALAGPRVHGVGRHLRQRDHPPRRRDPPGAVRRSRRATTTWPCCSSRSTTPPTTASRCCPLDDGPARRVGGAGPAGARAPGRRGRPPIRPSSTT